MSRRRKNRAAIASATPEVSSLIPAPSASGDVFSGKRAIDIMVVSPTSTHAGRLENQDPVLKQHGGWEGILLYPRMFRQFPTLAGVCHLAADKDCAIDRSIKAGDDSEGKSRELADLSVKLYRKIRDLHILNKKMAMGRFFGFAATGLSDWRVDEETGLLAPHDLYDIPQQFVKFGPSGEPFALTAKEPYHGEPIPEESVFFYRWGSRFSPYGEGDLQDVYLTTWYIKQVRQFGMQALEILGRPIPWVEVPMSIVGDEFDQMEAGLRRQYKYFVITRTNSNQTRVTFPTINVLANGAAGRSELEYIRFLYGEIYIRILGVQMTQDTSGGSRALESARLEVIGDKTPPASQARDQAWTDGWLHRVWAMNAPSVPRALWPRFDSDTSGGVSLNGAQITAVVTVGSMLALNQMSAVFAERTLQAAGIPAAWAADMVNATVAERTALAPPPVQQQSPPPRPDREEQEPEEEDHAAA